MEQIWFKACTYYNVPEDVAKSWYERVREHLNKTSPNRFYHNWDEMMMHKAVHLQHCKPSIVLAAFFQYYEFDGNRNCVEENCMTFKEFCTDALLDDEESKCLVLKLLGDKTIEYEFSSNYEHEANLLQDLDLSILAASQEEYKNYTQLLRKEYANMNDQSYKTMRLKVLETLLMIPNIFSSLEYQSKYEEQARQNIKQEISELKG